MADNLPQMVVVRTPLRVSLIGGGTDFPDFFNVNQIGSVISLAINKYIYVVIKRHAKIFNEKYRVSYSKTEVTDDVEKINNNIIRECIKFSNIQDNLFISTFSDIPAASGLGSSSALAVSLINGLHVMQNKKISKHQIAEYATEVEIAKLNQPIGKQDQYASTFGSINLINFYKSNRTSINSINFKEGYLDKLFEHATLYWTGLTRNVETILAEQKENLRKDISKTKKIYDLVQPFLDLLENQAGPKEIGLALHNSWNIKKTLSSNTTNKYIDQIYQQALDNGAYGGKICGGGGGGFMLLFHKKNFREKIKKACNFEYYIPVDLDFSGTEILFSA
jgi:D-glycero-alpha-D-manno-heptose-7-phosphate kinase